MKQNWLLFLYALPASCSSSRVSLWRLLKKLGAVPLKTSAYILPDTAQHYERFQWLAKQIRDGRGEAAIVRTEEIDGMSQREIHGAFNEARAADYSVVITDLTRLLRGNRRKVSESFPSELERLHRRFEEIRKIDFFESPRAQNALMLFRKAEQLQSPQTRQVPKLMAGDYRNKTWLTRPRPEIDRVGSAWLIKRFIDPKARFVFGLKPEEHPGAIPYDMVDVEFTHHGDDCTFETLLRRFALIDKVLLRIGEMIHEADLQDGKFPGMEAIGVDCILKGLGHLSWNDEQILQHGFISFDALYARLREE